MCAKFASAVPDSLQHYGCVGCQAPLSPSSLCSLNGRPMNPRDEVLRQGRDFNPGAGRLRRWQGSASK